jgi:hypothetical protein
LIIPIVGKADNGEGKKDPAAFCEMLVEPDPSAVAYDNRPGNRQTESGSLGLGSHDISTLFKTLECSLPITKGNAWSGILNSNC